MDLKNLKTFLYVAELGSFTKAAEILNFSQSTVSFQIKQLEKELEVPLFERINHTVILTSKGREVIRYAQQIYNLGEELKKSLSEEKTISGEVRIVMADSLYSQFFDKALVEFTKKYPNINLKILTSGTEEMFRLLNHNEVDMVVTLDNHIYNSDYIIAYEKEVEAHFVANVDHPFAKRNSLKIKELISEPFVLTEKGMSYRKLMEEKLAAKSLEIKPKIELGNPEQICKLVSYQAGLSFLPDHVTDSYVNEGTLVRLPVDDFKITIWKQLLYHRDKWVSPAMELVMELCKKI